MARLEIPHKRSKAALVRLDRLWRVIAQSKLFRRNFTEARLAVRHVSSGPKNASHRVRVGRMLRNSKLIVKYIHVCAQARKASGVPWTPTLSFSSASTSG